MSNAWSFTKTEFERLYVNRTVQMCQSELNQLVDEQEPKQKAEVAAASRAVEEQRTHSKVKGDRDWLDLFPSLLIYIVVLPTCAILILYLLLILYKYAIFLLICSPFYNFH